MSTDDDWAGCESLMYNSNMAEEWLTTAEAAELSGYHENYIRRVVRAGKVKAQKFGPTWQISRESLLEYLEVASKSSDKRWGAKR